MNQTIIGVEKNELTPEIFTKIKDAFKKVNDEHELVFCVVEEKEKEKVELLDTISMKVADINKMSVTQILKEFQICTLAQSEGYIDLSP